LPFNVSACVLPEGGRIVADFTVVPPVGSVMVLSPLDNVCCVADPGDAVFAAATWV
jgi:hypothetical protein